MERTLKNDDLIRRLCLLHDRNSVITESGLQSNEQKVGDFSHMTHNRNHSLGMYT